MDLKVGDTVRYVGKPDDEISGDTTCSMTQMRDYY